MFIRNQDFSPDLLDLVDAAEHAVRKIAPLFPLSQAVAVNPFNGLSDEPIAVAAARLERSAGVHIFPSRAVQLGRIEKGEITLEDIKISRLEIAPTLELSDQTILETAHTTDFIPQAIPTVADLAAEHSGTDWPNLVTERFGAWAQCHFDTGQALWAQVAEQGAWTSWRDWAMSDLTPEIFGLNNFCETISHSQRDHWHAIGDACAALEIDRKAAPSVFHGLLCDLAGWAGLGRYHLWEAQQAQTHNTTLSELLAIRLVWEQALQARYAKEVGTQWDAVILRHKEPLRAETGHLIDAILQRAAEQASARRLDTLLAQAGKPTNLAEPVSCEAQLVFCMDVRSERLRRALEIVDPGVQTYGLAGFVGLPLMNQAPAAENRKAARSVEVPDSSLRIKEDGPSTDETPIRDRLLRAISRFSRGAVSSFAYVEAAGLLKLAPLVDSSQFHERRVVGYGPIPRLTLDPSSEAAADVAEAALRSIGLRRNFAPLVVFVGHEARVTNDAQSALLQCGACCGHDAAVNVRALSCLLNETPLRELLAQRGIEIPPETVFRAGLHDTTGDTVTFFSTDPVGGRKPQPIKWLHDILDQACDIVRAERSTDLPATPRGGALYARGGDWSQTRAEWGLAGCHWFVAAPRNATRNRDFAGKVFLHNYDFDYDPDGNFLAEIVGGPLLVAAYTNLQYYGATVSPQHFGSGNKLVQNVCGEIGLLDGISGRLRAGGPSDQSLFLNGQPIHDALRLVARIAAPDSAIDAAIRTSPKVTSLVEHGWLEVASFGQT
ncbi:hypothetical protein DUF2309 [Octadecabacter antarcticus 307]|uniref:Uncharacterized protein n=1 Tax=Octadecabacter antarcticus 307 TaxID=391626 RepID=M9R8W8_9RHOB|nr:putative inorganic carbon transporter subunit DabA [Octadecabacter antarcticus]AGI69094.1 hypothetical protein DUF2309 [Octadecabacter antarcticus 307]